ncbi:MAG: MTAP family purine nucleoside phosphorylase [Candidatus Altiarchaeales archaeon]|nr:MTAP family purine nucleoside phosphorylase [Candidatus Altiarchaeales archaeon]
MIGILGGTTLYNVEYLSKGKGRAVDTKFGPADVIAGDGFVFINRHGKGGDILPHRINHRANISALREAGCDKIISFSSVGSLKREIPPESIILPHDYISFCPTPTVFDSGIVHVTPEIDGGLRDIIIGVAKRINVEVIEGGVYFQTPGPRLETKAEINLLKDYADIVGMTMASEATLSRELNMAFANICSVDNYAHGILDEKLDFNKILEEASCKRDTIIKLMTAVIEELK